MTPKYVYCPHTSISSLSKLTLDMSAPVGKYFILCMFIYKPYYSYSSRNFRAIYCIIPNSVSFPIMTFPKSNHSLIAECTNTLLQDLLPFLYTSFCTFAMLLRHISWKGRIHATPLTNTLADINSFGKLISYLYLVPRLIIQILKVLINVYLYLFIQDRYGVTTLSLIHI